MWNCPNWALRSGPSVLILYLLLEMIGIVESVKGASDIYAPIAGEIVEVNEAAIAKPSLINKQPMGEGWLCKLRPRDELGEEEDLFDQAGYEAFCRQ